MQVLLSALAIILIGGLNICRRPSLDTLIYSEIYFSLYILHYFFFFNFFIVDKKNYHSKLASFNNKIIHSLYFLTEASLWDEQRLIHDLFQNYSKFSRPVVNRNDQVVVTFRAKLKQIIDLVSVNKLQRN